VPNYGAGRRKGTLDVAELRGAKYCISTVHIRARKQKTKKIIIKERT
jgi:hypothetical protein